MSNEILDNNLTDEELLAIKGSRGGRTGGGTGVGPGGGFGGGFGGGGSGFLSGGGGGLGGDMLSALRRKMIAGANGPLAMYLSPMRAGQQGGDTVPAMLSPGEYVVNNRAMQTPGAAEMLAALNALGNGGQYAEGGMVLDPETFMRLLSALQAFSQGGEGVQEFAWGGQVQGQQGGFNAPRMPVQGRMAAPMGRMPSGGSGPSAGRYGPPAGGGLNTTPTMTNYGPNPALTVPPTAAPAGPVGWGQAGTQNPNTPDIWNSPAMQQMRRILDQFGAGGAFSPEGSAALMRSVQGQATSNADAMRARQQNALQLGGMDAGQAAAMKQMADLRGQGDVANALNAAQTGMLQNQQNFAQSLLGTMTQAQLQDYLAQLAFANQYKLSR